MAEFSRESSGKKWISACEERKLPPWAIVMPAGERNLLVPSPNLLVPNPDPDPEPDPEVARAQERMTPEEMAHLMSSLAAGLQHMHEKGLVQADFKS